MTTLPSVHVSYVGAVGRYLARLGFDPGPVYRRFGLSPDSVDGCDTRIPLREFFSLLEMAAQYAGDPHLGLHIYERFDFADLGLLGFALISAADVHCALHTLMRYGEVFQDCDDGQLILDGRYAHVWYRVDSKSLPLSRHDCDMSSAFIVFFLRKVIDLHWSPTAISLQYPRPDDTLVGEYQRTFGCPVSFGSVTNQVSFPRELLGRPLLSSDKRLYQVIERNLAHLQEQSRLGSSLAQQVQAAIARKLCHEPPTLVGVADEMGITARMLQRTLSARSVSFAELLEKTRRSLGTELLASTDYSLSKIASLLGYSEESAFIRAFRRWMNGTPLDYRHSFRRLSVNHAGRRPNIRTP